MDTRLSRFGIGPMIVAAVLVTSAAAAASAYAWPGICLLPESLALPARIIGAVLLLAGIPAWLIAAVAVMKAYNSDRLVTSGAFAIVRHPMYATWIVLNLPGIALVTRCWPVVFASVAGYAVFKKLVHRENDYLECRFGAEYLAYRARVGEILPIFSARPAARAASQK